MKKSLCSDGPIGAALRKVYAVRNPRAVVRELALDLHRAVQAPGPPFSPFLYTASLGLRVEYQEIEAEAVFVSARDNTPRIILRTPADPLDDVYRRRLNFTLAHEIGHFMIRRQLLGHVPDSVLEKESRHEEILCNLFAAELLMPRRVVRRDFERAGLRPTEIIALSERYDVSLQSLLCRATSLYSEALVAVFWTNREDRWSAEWASPLAYRDIILCDTNHTTVERALASGDSQFGLDSFLLRGQRMRRQSASLRLPGKSRVLTLITRCERGVRHLKPPLGPRSRESAQAAIEVPVQRWLPFGA